MQAECSDSELLCFVPGFFVLVIPPLPSTALLGNKN